MKKLLNEFLVSIRGGILYILSGSILIKIMSMLSNVIIAGVLDKSSYAHYSYAVNLYQYIDLFEGIGLASAFLIICPRLEDKRKMRGYLRYSFFLGGSVQMLLSIALCMIVYNIPLPFPEAKKYIIMMVFLPLLTYWFAQMQIYSRVQLENKFYSGVSIFQTLFLCVFGILFTWYFSSTGMILARYLSLAAALFVCLYHFRSFLFHTIPSTLSKDERKDFLFMGGTLFLSNVFSSLMPLNETFLVNNIIRDEVVVSNFKIAGLFPAQLSLITGAVVIYYFPIIAKITEPTKQWEKIKTIGIVNIILVLIAAAAGALLTPVAIHILYQGKYDDAIPLTYMLWAMRMTNAAIRIVPMNALAAVGCTKFNVIVIVASCAVQTVLDYILISIRGIYGVSYATNIVYLISGIVMWVYLRYICKKRAGSNLSE